MEWEWTWPRPDRVVARYAAVAVGLLAVAALVGLVAGVGSGLWAGLVAGFVALVAALALYLRWRLMKYSQEVVWARLAPPLEPTHVEFRRHNGATGTRSLTACTHMDVRYTQNLSASEPFEAKALLHSGDGSLRLRTIAYSPELAAWVSRIREAGLPVSEETHIERPDST
ncbi:hypothetical protein [Actinokineospora diospyrosa]|uniref:PH (Pleckstrin Homology) domain-containing protein n=1 Tax=Actinokineospora diospyrosa TaxID=103728 RepID=A0ABT1IJX7_9PSEU|nr:hypothetical protein [Actinokineospora diospyrosa]MCP2272826.1 hypothetical protein [Actinokineospora diospyrosa]